MKLKPAIRLGTVCLTAALLLMLAAALPRHVRRWNFTAVPLAPHDYFKDVAEPITIVDGKVWDGGGGKGLSFKDSKGVVRSVCLRDGLDGGNDLVLGSMTPDRGAKVAVGGPEEQAFLGLLQRWSLQDPEAREWSRRIEQWLRADIKHSILKGDETAEQLRAMFAVKMMLKLLRRN